MTDYSTYFGPGAGINIPIDLTPFSEVENDEEDVLSWLISSAEDLLEYYAPYRRLYWDNLAVYLGYARPQYRPGWIDGIDPTDTERKTTGQKLNILQPVIESFLARITSSRSNVTVLPVHSHEYHDLAAAKIATDLIKMSFLDRDMDTKLEDSVRSMLIYGTSYTLVFWNPEIGKQKNNQSLGDVDYKVLRPDQVLEQPGNCRENKDWYLVYDYEEVYQLERRYPHLKGEIEAGDWSPQVLWGPLQWAYRDTGHKTIVFYLYHRATEEFPEGRYVVATKDMILEDGPLPYPSLNKYKMLPICRLDDTVPPGYDIPLPMSVMETGKAYQELFQRVNKNILRNMSLNTPKWIVHAKSSVRLSHLNNSPNVIQYNGDPSFAPRMESPQSTPAEFFQYRDQLQQEMLVNTGASQNMSEPPPNTRATSMLQHYEEQEFKRAEPLIKHVNDYLAQLAKVGLAIMADMYNPQDERTVKLMGGKSAASYMRFKVSDLIGPFDVRYERSSALPESKQGRLNEAARMLELGVIDLQQYKTLIGYSGDPDLASSKTKAYEKQLLENDKMLRPEPDEFGQMHFVGAQDPKEHEDHVEHLKALYPLIQSIEFDEAPQEAQEMVMMHTMAHEMFAWSKAAVSIQYAMNLAEIPEFPLFFTELPMAIPVQQGVPPTPLDSTIKTRMETPGLSPSQSTVPQASQQSQARPGPDAPHAV